MKDTSRYRKCQTCGDTANFAMQLVNTITLPADDNITVLLRKTDLSPSQRSIQ